MCTSTAVNPASRNAQAISTCPFTPCSLRIATFGLKFGFGDGKDGEKVEDDMDQAARAEATDVEGALKELGLSKGDTEVEALEGAWA